MLSIQSIMTENVVTVMPQTPIYEALDLLAKHRISGMPVVDEQGHVVGILTEKDVLRILIDKRLDVKNTVDDYMRRDVICFTEQDSAIELCRFFIRSHIRRVPIVRDQKLIGIVSRADIIPLILEAKNKISEFRYA